MTTTSLKQLATQVNISSKYGARLDQILAEGAKVTDGYFPYTVVADTRDEWVTVQTTWAAVYRILKSQLELN